MDIIGTVTNRELAEIVVWFALVFALFPRWGRP